MSHPSLSHFLIYIAHLCPLAFYKEMLFIPSTGSLLSLWKLWCRGKDPVSCSGITCAFLGRQSGKKQRALSQDRVWVFGCLENFFIVSRGFFSTSLLGNVSLSLPFSPGREQEPIIWKDEVWCYSYSQESGTFLLLFTTNIFLHEKHNRKAGLKLGEKSVLPNFNQIWIACEVLQEIYCLS